MISIPPSVKIYFCVMPVDMRCSFDALSELVRQYFREEPQSGHLFVSRNKREDCMKILYWDRDGHALWYKRLEKGTFTLPRGKIDGGVEIDGGTFSMLIGGFDFEKLKRKKTNEKRIGERLIKIDYPGMNNYTQFSFDGLGRNSKIVETVSGSVTSTKQFVWCSDSKRPFQACEERDGLGTLTKRFFAFGEAISSTKYFYSGDHLASVREMTDASANIQAEYAFDPYGRTTTILETVAADFKYTGHYFHRRSLSSLTMYRSYSAYLGRWVSRDPEEEADGLNLFEYVGSEPIGWFDPDGEGAAGAIAGGAIGGVIGGLTGHNPASVEAGAAIGAEIGSGVQDVGIAASAAAAAIMAMSQHGNSNRRPNSSTQAGKRLDCECKQPIGSVAWCVCVQNILDTGTDDKSFGELRAYAKKKGCILSRVGPKR